MRHGVVLQETLMVALAGHHSTKDQGTLVLGLLTGRDMVRQ
jgi:hypothetical protein